MYVCIHIYIYVLDDGFKTKINSNDINRYVISDDTLPACSCPIQRVLPRHRILTVGQGLTCTAPENIGRRRRRGTNRLASNRDDLWMCIPANKWV